MYIKKSIEIDKPIIEVYEFLKLIRNHNQFSVWNMADPHQKVTNSGEDGTVGYIYSWDSKMKNVGAGTQEITEMKTNEFIAYVIRFDRPMKNLAQAKFILEELTGNSTNVSWEFRGPTKFPMSLFKGIFEKMLGKDMAKSMDNLKAVLEK